MLTLAADASLPLLSVALLDDRRLLGAVALEGKGSRNEKLLPAIDWLLTENDVDRRAVELFAVTRGHGIPTVTFGAGQNNIHAVGEYVDLAELAFPVSATLVLYFKFGQAPTHLQWVGLALTSLVVALLPARPRGTVEAPVPAVAAA